MAHARAVEKFHDAGLDRRRLGMGNHGRCDDHVAAVVEGELWLSASILAAPLTPEQVKELIQNSAVGLE